MPKTLKARTEELMLGCLSTSEWADEALYQYTDKLLDMTAEIPRSARELEALTRLVSQYAMYLPPEFCSDNFEWTELDKMEELSTIKNNLDFILNDAFPYVPFTSCLRIKTLESFFEKIWRKGSTPLKAESDLKDLIAFRFVLAGRSSDEYVNECFLFFELIVEYLVTHCGFRPVPGTPKGTKDFDPDKFAPSVVYIPTRIPNDCKHILQGKNYILTPKKNGYQGLQISLYSPQRNLYIEVQVKTLIMLENSEFYESSHDLVYKASDGGTAQIESKLFDGYDLSQLNGLHGFRSRDGIHFIDHLGLLTPRFY